MYENIVVAFDDSECSRAALREVAHWIKRHGGKAILVYSVFFDEEEFAMAPSHREKRLELAKKICYETQEKFSAEFGFQGELEAMISEGEPHEVIVKIAEARNADLIAMGTHGRKGIKKLFMGSVTSRVVASSPCDVIIVKQPRKDYTGVYKSILLSFDGSEFSKKALGKACELSRIDGAAITALHVIPHYEEMIEFYTTSGMKERQLLRAEKLMEDAKDIASQQGVEISTEITDGNETENIIRAANKLKSDLIIRGTHKWTGVNKAIIGSVIESLVINAPCPILVVQ
ncbi:MAG: universal stress protein [Dissulfurispiraceae bacterium]